jgi:hypothetical protein
MLSGFSSGLLNLLEAGSHLLVKNVGIFQRGLEISVIEGLLNQLEIASLAKQFRRKVMPLVVEPEVSDLGSGPQPPPRRL